MKFNAYLAILSMAALCASCVKEPFPEDGTGHASGDDNQGYVHYGDDVAVRGWVRIKLDESAAPLKVGAFTRGEVDSGDARLDEIAAQLGATEIRRVYADGGRFAERRRRFGLHRWYDIKIDEDIPVTRAEASIADLPGISYAQPVYKVKLLGGPIVPAEYVYIPATTKVRQSMTADDLPFDDPDLPKQWHYNNDGSLEGSVPGADINLFEGWEVLGTKGDPEIIVAVIDSGVQWDHPDLADNMWINEAELNGEKNVDDDGNGYIDDIYGGCFMPNYRPHDEPNGLLVAGTHGTHVAGTIAAVNGNGKGGCGVAGGTGNKDGVKLMTLQIIRDDASDDIPLDDVFAYAADNGAVIASCSWTVSQDGMDQATKDGIDYFRANAGWDDLDGDGINDVQTGPMQGGLVIAGAGNSGTNEVFYPAKYEGVVGVGAIDADMTVAWYSEYGEGIDIMAPGGNQPGTADYNRPEEWGVYSTYPGDGYAFSAGTSMATPHVSGIAALILAKFKGQGFTADELRSRLERSCRPLGIYMDPKYHGGIGKGLIDVTLALTERPTEGPQTPQFEAIAAPTAVKITGPVPVDGNGMPVATYNFEYAEVVNGTAGEMTRTVLTNNYDAGEQFVYMFPGKSEAEYKFRLNAVDRYGNESEYIELQSETLEFENHAPELLREFSDVEIRQAGEEYARLYTLVNYFDDADEQYGDEITFSAENSNDKVVKTELRGGRALAIIPIAKGTSVVTVTATDTRGASTSATINVTVLAGSAGAPVFSRELGSLTLPSGGSFMKEYDLNLYVTDAEMPDDELTFAAVSSDEGIVSASVDGATLRVTALAQGNAVVTVTVTDRAGESDSDELSVSVNEEPGSQPGAAQSLSLWPNPADDYVNVGLRGAGAGSADIIFYDAAARRVFETEAELDANGTARIDAVGGFAPGVYTVVVHQGGSEYRGTVVKK